MHLINTSNTLTYIDFMPAYSGFNVTEFGKETNNRNSLDSLLQYRYNHIIHFVLDGTGNFYCDGKTYPLKAGKAFVITPENLIKYWATEPEGWTYCWLAFSGTDCAKVFEKCGFSENVVFDFTEDIIKPLLEKLAENNSADEIVKPAFSLSVNAMAFEVLSNCASFLKPNEKNQKVSSSIIDTAVLYMKNNMHRSINISMMCKELRISRTYFSALFESTMKTSPYAYLLNLRMQRASELLLSDKELKVYEIAEIVGFSSQAQFCKTFSKLTGVSPLKFKSKYQA